MEEHRVGLQTLASRSTRETLEKKKRRSGILGLIKRAIGVSSSTKASFFSLLVPNTVKFRFGPNSRAPGSHRLSGGTVLYFRCAARKGDSTVDWN